MFEAPHAAPALALEGVDLGAGRRWLAGLLQSQRDGALLDAHVAEQDQGCGPVRTGAGAPEPQELFNVETAPGVLDDVDRRLAQLELEEEHAAGREVERIVARVHTRERGHQRCVRVEQLDVPQRDAREEGPPDVPDLDRAVHHLAQLARRDPAQQAAPGAGADQGAERPEERSEQPRHEPQRRRERVADHQKACPTANWTMTRRQNVAGRGG